MKELVRTNDAVYISFAQAILAAEGIETFLLDANMASVEGSLGAAAAPHGAGERFPRAPSAFSGCRADAAEHRHHGGSVSRRPNCSGTQPKDGFRAGHDSVLLAAAVPARRRACAGTGVGRRRGQPVSLPRAWAVANIAGIEIDAELAMLANANAARNNMAGPRSVRSGRCDERRYRRRAVRSRLLQSAVSSRTRDKFRPAPRVTAPCAARSSRRGPSAPGRWTVGPAERSPPFCAPGSRAAGSTPLEDARGTLIIDAAAAARRRAGG